MHWLHGCSSHGSYIVSHTHTCCVSCDYDQWQPVTTWSGWAILLGEWWLRDPSLVGMGVGSYRVAVSALLAIRRGLQRSCQLHQLPRYNNFCTIMTAPWVSRQKLLLLSCLYVPWTHNTMHLYRAHNKLLNTYVPEHHCSWSSYPTVRQISYVICLTEYKYMFMHMIKYSETCL